MTPNPEEKNQATDMEVSLDYTKLITGSALIQTLRDNDALTKEDEERLTRNLLLSDPVVASAMRNDFLERAEQKILSRKDMLTVNINECLKEEEKNRLMNIYREFHIKFMDKESTSSHPYSKASRYLQFLRAFYGSFHYKPGITCGKDHDCYICDSGGNVPFVIKGKFTGVHCCCPVLDVNDAARKAQREDFLEHVRVSCRERVVQKLAELYHRKDPKFICENKTEYCNIKCKYMLFLHSSYDRSPKQLVEAMYRANSEKGLGVMLYDPNIFHRDEGRLKYQNAHWKKFVKRNKKGQKEIYIDYYFEGDPQNGYRHRLKNITSYMKTFVVNHREYSYTFAFKYVKDECIWFEICRSKINLMRESVVTRYIPAFPFGKYTVLYGYKWQTKRRNDYHSILDKTINHMRPVRFVVPTLLFERIYGLASVLPPGRFTFENLLTAARAYNNRMIINGTSIKMKDDSGERVSDIDLPSICNLIYFMVYVNKYELSQTLQTLIKEEDQRRKFVDSFWTRLRMNCGRKLFTRKLETHELEIENQIISTLKDGGESAVNEDQCWVKKFFISVIEKFNQFPEKYQVYASVAPTAIGLEEEIHGFLLDEEIMQNTQELVVDLTSEIREKINGALMNDLEEVKITRQYVDAVPNHECNEKLKRKCVPGDGRCLFYALIEAANLDITAEELAKNLLESASFEELSEEEKKTQRKILDPNTEVTDLTERWGDDLTIKLFVSEYLIGVCVHSAVGRSILLGSRLNRRIHLLHTGQHFDALVPSEELCSPKLAIECKGGENEILEEEGVINIEEFAKTKLRKLRMKDPKTIDEILDKSFPLGDFKRPGMNVLYGALGEILRYSEVYDKITLTTTALDVDGAPGNFVDLIRNKTSGDIYGFTRNSLYKADCHILEIPEVELENQVDNMVSIIKEHEENGVDLIFINLGKLVKNDTEKCVWRDSEEDRETLLTGAILTLKRSGTLVISMPAEESEFVYKVLSCFDSVKYYISNVTRPLVNQMFVVAQNYSERTLINVDVLKNRFKIFLSELSRIDFEALSVINRVIELKSDYRDHRLCEKYREILTPKYVADRLKGGKTGMFNIIIGRIFKGAKGTESLRARFFSKLASADEEMVLLESVPAEESTSPVLPSASTQVEAIPEAEPNQTSGSTTENRDESSAEPSAPEKTELDTSYHCIPIVQEAPIGEDEEWMDFVDLETKKKIKGRRAVFQGDDDGTKIFSLFGKLRKTWNFVSEDYCYFVPEVLIKIRGKEKFIWSWPNFKEMKVMRLGCQFGEALESDSNVMKIAEKTFKEGCQRKEEKRLPYIDPSCGFYMSWCLAGLYELFFGKRVDFAKYEDVEKTIHFRSVSKRRNVEERPITDKPESVISEDSNEQRGEFEETESNPDDEKNDKKREKDKERIEEGTKSKDKTEKGKETQETSSKVPSAEERLEKNAMQIVHTGNSLEEYKQLLKFTDESANNRHRDAFLDLYSRMGNDFALRCTFGGYRLINKAGFFVENYQLTSEGPSWRMGKKCEHEYFYLLKEDGGNVETGFYPLSESKILGDKLGLVSDYTKKFLEPKISKEVQKLTRTRLREISNIDYHFIQAGPGCGKTTMTVRDCALETNNLNALIVLPTVNSCEDVRRRVMKKTGLSEEQVKPYIRTFASVVLNQKHLPSVEEVWIDEVMMMHAGQVVVLAMLLKPKKVFCVGDILQIPFVNRYPDFGDLNYNDLMTFAKVSTEKVLNCSHRIPVDICCNLTKEYERSSVCRMELKTYNEFGMKESSVKVRKISSEAEIPVSNDKDTYYLTFTQGDKDRLVEKGLKNVSTIHEFQGLEAVNVNVVRLNPYPSAEIFSRPEYILVALSRTRKYLTYFTVYDEDVLSKRIEEIRKYDFFTKKRCLALKGGSKEYYTVAESGTMYVTNQMIKSRSSAVIKVNTGKYHKKYDYNIKIEGSCIEEIKNQLKRIDRDFVKLYITDDFKKHISANLMSKILLSVFGGDKTFVLVTQDEYVTNEIFQVLNMNGMGDYIRIEEEIEELKIWREPVQIEECYDVRSVQRPCIEILQMYHDEVFDQTYSDMKWDNDIIRNSLLQLPAETIVIDPTTDIPVNHSFDCLEPALKTLCPLKRERDLLELMLSLSKRNFSMPQNQGEVDEKRLAQRMLDRFIEAYVDKDLLKLSDRSKIDLNSKDIMEWLETQESHVYGKIVGKEPLHMTPLNQYSVDIKQNPKIVVSKELGQVYVPCQTIVYHEKDINVIFCPIMKKVRTRIMEVLKSNVIINTDMSVEEFEQRLSAVLDGCNFNEDEQSAELDFSKYDKSQMMTMIYFEAALLTFFGADPELVELWVNAHLFTILTNKNLNLKAFLCFQRKSGDAFTFFGNTLFLLAVIAVICFIENATVVIAAGDDSYFRGPGVVPRRGWDTQKISLLFNLEVKFFNFENPYFCSKFLVPVDGGMRVVPDPLKLLVKLGRGDLRNYEHVEEYRISFLDNIQCYRDQRVVDFLKGAINERYNLNFSNVEGLLGHLLAFAESKESFASLYYKGEGTTLLEGQQNPKLD